MKNNGYTTSAVEMPIPSRPEISALVEVDATKAYPMCTKRTWYAIETLVSLLDVGPIKKMTAEVNGLFVTWKRTKG